MGCSQNESYSTGQDQLFVHDGEEATVTVHTSLNTEGSIEVDYKSGLSLAKGLTAQKGEQKRKSVLVLVYWFEYHSRSL